MKINKEEIKEFVKTIRNAYDIISYNNGSTFELRKMNEDLLEAANIIENLEKEISELKGYSTTAVRRCCIGAVLENYGSTVRVRLTVLT